MSQSTATSSGKAENPSTHRRHPEPSPLGAFAQLPQEVREMIYAPAFAGGSVALTRVSKALRESTKRSLYQHGVGHIHIECTMAHFSFFGGSHYNWELRSEAQRSIPCDVIAKIQNLQFYVTSIEENLDTYEELREVLFSGRKERCGMIMGRFANSMDKARHCHIQLTRQALNHFKDGHINGVRLRKIFKSVTAEIIDESEQ